MSRESLKIKIKKEDGYILSDGTHNYQALLCKAYDLIVDFNIKTNLKDEIAKALGNSEGTSAVRAYFYNQLPKANDDEMCELWYEDVFQFFDSIAPNGFYFGSLYGDGACIGWFKFK